MTEKVAKLDPTVPNETHTPTWVQDMHEHFHRTGFYRSSDLGRVLGNPRDRFEGQASDQLIAASQLASR